MEEFAMSTLTNLDGVMQITTDLADYSPGSTAIITTTDVPLGASVQFEIQHVIDPGADGIYGTADDVIESTGGDGHATWIVTDGGAGDLDMMENGVVSTSWYVNPDDSAGARFLLTAVTLDPLSGAPTGTASTATFTDSYPDPITIGDGTQFIVEQNPTGQSAGSGVINTFLRIQDDPLEEGYNTDGAVQLDTVPGFARAITLNDVPIVTKDGIAYREFRLDLNESNGGNNQNITLNSLQIWAAETPDQTDFVATGDGDGSLPDGSRIWNMDNPLTNGETTINLFDWNSGSGKGDYVILIPVSAMVSVTGNPFIYLYAQFGGTSPSDGGFEEFYLLTKAANPSLTIAKSVSSVTGAIGNIVDSAGDVINYTIVVNNTGNVDLTGVVLTDEFAPASLTGGDADNDGVLDITETWTYTASHTVTQAEMDSGETLVNVATVYASYNDNAFEKLGDASTTINQAKTLHIEKDATVADGTADEVDDLINYTMAVTNTGNAAISGVAVTDAFTTDEAYVSGDADSDGKLDVGETWLYTASHLVTQAELDAGGTIDNTATVTGFGATSDDDTASIDITQRPSLTIAKNVSFVTGGTNDNIVDSAFDIINYTINVTNTGNITLTGITVSDPTAKLSTSHTDANGNGTLDVGETWQFTATHTVTQDEFNEFQTITNVATVSSAETSQSQSASANTALTSIAGLTAGFWGQHFEAWDGDEIFKRGVADTQRLVDSGVLTKKDAILYNGAMKAMKDLNGDGSVNASDKGVLLGDINGNGIRGDDGTNNYLFVSLAAAQKIILSSDSASDTRQILMKQALAAQLNINNGEVQPNNLINEAVRWLKGEGPWEGPYVYSNSTGKVDTNGNGNLDSTEFNVTTGAFTSDANGVLTGTALTSNLSAWQAKVDVDDTVFDVRANGEGLKNALMYFNQNQLITLSNGNVAFTYDHVTVVGQQSNVLDAFWHTLDLAAPDIKGIGAV
jgi:uncharacterized repeat protein (TIGR01451 family)